MKSTILITDFDQQTFINGIQWSYSPQVSRRFTFPRSPMIATHFTAENAEKVASQLGIDWHAVRFDTEQFRRGMDVELEHGTRDPETNVTDDDPLATGKIALAHLREFPDYYTRLTVMEREADTYWKNDT